jgi:hypothetical protein
VLTATVDTNDLATSARFEWGVSTAYGNRTPAQSIPAGRSGVAVSANLTGLSPNTTYHFRVTATSSAGTTTGAGATFKTRTDGKVTPPLPGPIAPSSVYGSYIDPVFKTIEPVPQEWELRLEPDGTFGITVRMSGIQTTVSFGRYQIEGNVIFLRAPYEDPFNASVEGRLLTNAVVVRAPIGSGIWVKRNAQPPSLREVVGQYVKEDGFDETMEIRADGTYVMRWRAFGSDDIQVASGTWDLTGHVINFKVARSTSWGLSPTVGVALGQYICLTAFTGIAPTIWVKR